MEKRRLFAKAGIWLFAAAMMAALCVPALFNQSARVVEVAAAEAVTIVSNPYADVDWAAYGQYRANLHTHSTKSDGGYGGTGVRDGTPEKMAQVYNQWQNGAYGFLAITDHHGYAGATPVTDPWSQNPAFSTPGLVGIIGNEISGIERTGPGGDTDIQVLFTDFSKSGTGYGVAQLLTEASPYDGGNGRFVFNHPGRTTNNSSASILNGTGIGSLTYFHNLFKEYPQLVGLELVNQADRHPNDRSFWDELLSKKPADLMRNIFGYANDDTHGYVDNNSYPYNAPGMGYSWSTFLVPKAAYEAGGASARGGLKDAMDKGASFFSSYSTVGKFSNTVPKGSNWQTVVNQKHSNAAANRSGSVPKVTALVANNASGTIAITAENCDKIQWISKDGLIVKTDTLTGAAGTATLNLSTSGVEKYVRAVLTVDEAGDSPCQTFTQPILLSGAGTEPPQASVASISITAKPNKTVYTKGEAENWTGLVVTATLADNTTKVLTAADYHISGFNSSTVGEKTITVTYADKTAEFTITVQEAKKSGGCGGGTVSFGGGGFFLIFGILAVMLVVVPFAGRRRQPAAG